MHVKYVKHGKHVENRWKLIHIALSTTCVVEVLNNKVSSFTLNTLNPVNTPASYWKSYQLFLENTACTLSSCWRVYLFYRV